MNVFISWSESDSPSYKLAESLNDWLPKVIGSIKPYMSTKGILPGAPWFSEIVDALKNSSYSIICITRKSMESPWIHFEAGVIYNSLKKPCICPILIDLTPAQLQGPLKTFQGVSATKKGIFSLLVSINQAQSPSFQLPEQQFKESFEKSWPALYSKLKKLKEEAFEDYRSELITLSKSFEKFWSIFLKKLEKEENITVILSGKWGVEWKSGAPTTKPGHTAQLSYNEVNSFLMLLKKLKPFVERFNLIHGEAKNQSTNEIIRHEYSRSGKIIIVGSIHANSECERYMKKATLPFEFVEVEKEKYIHFHPLDNRDCYKSFPDIGEEIDKNNEDKKDYGLIIRITNPFYPDCVNKVLILAGNHGFGTESAIKFVADHNKIDKLNKMVGESDFAVLFHSYVIGQEGDEMINICKACIKKKNNWELVFDDKKS